MSATVTLPSNTSGISETKTQTVNLLGQLVTVSDHYGSTLTNTYDASGNVLTIERHGNDDKSATSTMTYDALGRKKTLVDSDLGSWTYAYNALGEQVRQASSTTCMSSRHDGQGRVFSKSDYANASCSGTADITASWIYDSATDGRGEVAQSTGTDNGITTTQIPQYDSFGRTEQVGTQIGAASYTQRSTYDEFGRPFQSFFSGAGLAETGELYLYNAQGYGYQTQDGENGATGQVYRMITAMDQRGNVTGEVRAGNSAALTTTRTYDAPMGWLTGITTGAIQSLSYQYDNLGNQSARGDASGTPAPGASLNETFSYDGLQRLTAQSTPTIGWSYDSFGNPSGGNPTYGTKGANCTAANEVIPGVDALSASKGLQYCYDAHGNQTRVLNGATVQQASTYTADDKLRRVQTATSNHTTDWVYGPERARVVRLDYADAAATSTPITTHYVGAAEIIGVGTDNPTVKRYLPGLILTQTGAGIQYEYLFTDNLGSTHRITDQNGDVLSAERFGAFGQRSDAANDDLLDQITTFNFDTSLTHHGFTGQEQMDESGLIHMNGRVYSPGTMRFTQADPFVTDAGDLQSLNRYSYVLNNPLVHTDPSGYWGKKEQGYLRLAVAIAITVVSEGSAHESMEFAAAADAAGDGEIAASYTADAAMTSISGGYLSGFVASGNLNGAVLGALSSGVNFGIGQAVPSGDIGSSEWAENASVHAVAGGVLEVLGGGKFGHGFVIAGAGAALSPAYSKDPGIGTVEAAVVGGTLSQVTGGKFANGALSAAFEFSFNQMLHSGEAPVRKFSSDDITTSGNSDSLSKDDIAALKQDMARAMNIFSDMVGRSGNAEMIGIVQNVKGIILDLDDWNTKTFNGELLSKSTPAYANFKDQTITFSADRMEARDSMYSKVNVISHEFRHLTPYNNSIFVDYKKSPWGSNPAERDAEGYRREMMDKYWNTNRYMGN